MLPNPTIPIILLTGFLGSGKTTLVNTLLQSQQQRDIAVIVNEFGEIGIDHHLIRRVSANVVELVNGCVCCTIRQDLLTTLQELLKSRPNLDYILIETTGLADPGPIAQTFFHPAMEETVRLDAIITVVDGENFWQNLSHSAVTAEQIRVADLILLSKTDLISPAQIQELEESIWDRNPLASVLPCEHGQVPLEVLLGVEHQQRDWPHTHAHHEADIQSFVFRSKKPLDSSALASWAQALPRNVLRGKGIVQLAKEKAWYVLHLVGSRCTLEEIEPWEQSVCTEIVVIGTNLDVAALEQGLNECIAQPTKSLWQRLRK